MSTASELENVYEVRGRRVQINYDEEDHSATFHSRNIGDDFDPEANPQTQLEDLGIYTRVQDITDFSNNHVTVTLKPAASVELRGSPEEGTKLQARPISKQFDGSTISKRRGKYGYQATCGRDILATLYDVPNDETLQGSVGQAAVYAELRDGHLALRVEPEETPHSMTSRVDSTGLIGIPNGLGAAADLDGHGVSWELTEDEDALVGKTTFELDTESMPSGGELADDPEADPYDRLHRSSISYVTQDVERNGKEWTQTHFTVYLTSGQMQAADWGIDNLFPAKWDEKPDREDILASFIDIHLVNLDGELGLKLTNHIRPRYVDDVTIEETTVPEDADPNKLPTIVYKYNPDYDPEDEDSQRLVEVEKYQGDAYFQTKASTAPCVRRIHKNINNEQATFSFPHSLAYALTLGPDTDDASSRDIKWGVRETNDHRVMLGDPLGEK